MKVLFAQGNPGEHYASTRHNVGWRYVTAYAAKQGIGFGEKAKFKAEIAEFSSIEGEKVLLVKPQTFYNDTGLSARAIADFYKLEASDFLVIHDELALPLGTLRTREQGSHAGNNGIRSLIEHLGPDFARLRIGIHTELADRMDAADFVLGYFSTEEYKILDNYVPKVMDIFDDFVEGEFATTTHK